MSLLKCQYIHTTEPNLGKHCHKLTTAKIFAIDDEGVQKQSTKMERKEFLV